VVLKGSFDVLLFNNAGDITHIIHLDENTTRGVDIKAGVWHTLLSLKSGSVIFEVKEGPYVPIADTDFAPWAPAEGNEESESYLLQLKKAASMFTRLG